IYRSGRIGGAIIEPTTRRRPGRSAKGVWPGVGGRPRRLRSWHSRTNLSARLTTLRRRAVSNSFEPRVDGFLFSMTRKGVDVARSARRTPRPLRDLGEDQPD